MTATRTMTTTLVALAMATVLAAPAAAAPPTWLPEPELTDLVSDNPLAHCLPDMPGDADLSLIAACVLETLPDIVGNTHAASIVAVVVHGIAEGFGDGTFRPELPVTRGQMAAFLQRALELAPGQASGLHDVAGTHADAINALVAAGIAEGFGDGTFRPQLPVTRGQMAAFLERALELAPGQASGLHDVAGTHADAINALVAAGIAEGFGDGTFRPQLPVTRGQMATFLTRALDL